MKLCIAAVNKDSLSYVYVKKYLPQFVTKELCDIAVKGNFDIIQYIPKQFITYELCRDAVINGEYTVIYHIIKYLPQFVTDELCDIVNSKCK